MDEYKVLISGSYNVFNEGWDGAGVYMASGLYQSQTFKAPIYIGSSQTLQDRIEWRHISRLDRNKHENQVFQRDWDKHGKDNFVWFLIESTPVDQTIITEQKYLDLYRPFVDEFGGFNIAHLAANPAKKGWHHSEEAKAKISQTRKEKIASGEIIKTNLGKKYSEERKRQMSEARKGKSNTATWKKVKCIETDIIYDSISEAANKNNLRDTSIGAVCRGIYHTSGGFHWEYINNEDKKLKRPPKQLEPTVVGELRWNSKLKEYQVKEIREKYKAGGYSHRTLAREYNIGYTAIHNIVNNLTWTHI